MEAQEELYVALPEKSKEGMSLLLWALRNAPKDIKIVITHVYILDQMIPGPLGGRVHPSIASQIELIAYRQEEKSKAEKKLDDYTRQCAKAKFKCEKLVFGSNNDIASGILELIALKGIKKLIMGAAEDRRYSMRMIEPTSNKAKSVMKRADTSCTIWFVCKGNLIYTREANQEKTIKPLQLPLPLPLPLPCSCSLSPERTQEQYSYSSSGSSPGRSYKISDGGSLFMTEADAASCADLELKDALADLTLIVQKTKTKYGT
ncbi:U-box domain-containing protein 33-like isoform X2 [Carex rostrata]